MAYEGKPAQVKIRYGDSGVWKFLKEHEALAAQEFAELMYDLGKVGEDSMKLTISTSGTPWSRFRKSRWGIGKSGFGRIDTGAMYESIASRPRRGKNVFETEVGYLKNNQPYFGIQDGGRKGYFRNLWTANPSGKYPFFFKRKIETTTEGTHALRDARQDMLDAEPRLARRMVARLLKKGVDVR